MIITIGREYGSQGHQIGEIISKKLGIPLYDKELLQQAAKNSGLCEEIFNNQDEKPTNSFLYSLVMDTYSGGLGAASFLDMPLNHKVFLAQFDAIRKIAEAENSCVIIGRCADYALAEYKNVINVFVHADMEARINWVAERENLTLAKAKDSITKTDKQRASYYNYYTNKKWGEARGYDLTINSGKLSIEACADIIIAYAQNACK